jgi:hypothetical protein
MVIAGPDLSASILKCLPAIDGDGLDVPFAEIDFDLEGAEEQRLLLFNFFDVIFQQFNNPRETPTLLNILRRFQRKLCLHARVVLARIPDGWRGAECLLVSISDAGSHQPKNGMPQPPLATADKGSALST